MVEESRSESAAAKEGRDILLDKRRIRNTWRGDSELNASSSILSQLEISTFDHTCTLDRFRCLLLRFFCVALGLIVGLELVLLLCCVLVAKPTALLTR